MLPESHPLIRRALRFAALPYCYVKLVNWKECTVSRFQVLKDLLYIFFKLKYFPDNYSPCRLWEKDRKAWNFYYGSSYDPYQRKRMRREVQPFEYLVLFDDKEVCELLCRGINVLLPRYFGAVSPEMNYKTKIEEAIQANAMKAIIIKPTMGQGGRGVALAFYDKGKIRVKYENTEVDLSDFVLRERSILQEVLVQHNAVSSLSSSSLNTIRVLTLYTRSNSVMVISASMRFGVGDSIVDNWCAGGVAVGVDHERGCLKKFAYDKRGQRYAAHPTSGLKFEGFEIPHWDKVIAMAQKVQEACPFFRLLGMDIGIREDGNPVLVEVNPNSDIVFQEQTAGPLLMDRTVYEEFKKYDLLVNKYQRHLYE